MNLANVISVGRILFIPPLIYAMLNLQAGVYYIRLATVMFLAMAASDWLDGYLARKMNWRTDLGTLLDPLADKLLIVSSLVVLSIVELPPDSLRLPWWVATVAIAKDLMVSIGFWMLVARLGKLRIQPKLLGKVCTFFQLVTIAGVLLSPMLSPGTRMIVPVIWSVATLAAVASALDYVQTGRRMARARAHAAPGG